MFFVRSLRLGNVMLQAKHRMAPARSFRAGAGESSRGSGQDSATNWSLFSSSTRATTNRLRSDLLRMGIEAVDPYEAVIVGLAPDDEAQDLPIDNLAVHAALDAGRFRGLIRHGHLAQFEVFLCVEHCRNLGDRFVLRGTGERRSDEVTPVLHVERLARSGGSVEGVGESVFAEAAVRESAAVCERRLV